MTLRLRSTATLLACLALAPASARAQATAPDYPRGRISGYIFGDWYSDLAGDPHHGYTAAGADSAQPNIDGNKVIGQGLNGFQIRRIYFQLDNDLSARVSTRFRLEADGKSLTSDGKLGVAVKAGYLQVKSLYPRGDLFFGLITTPMWENSEDYWQYRPVEKTIADFRGLYSAADMGAELKGYLDPNHVVGYSAMVGNGVGQKPETNRQKRSSLALPLHWRDLRVEPYVDYENVFGGLDRASYKAFVGYDLPHGALGWEGVTQVQHAPAGPYHEPRGHSFFARCQPRPEWAAFARLDLWDPDRRLANRVTQQLWIAGVDWQPMKDVHVMPNVEAMQYQRKGNVAVPPHHDLQAKITFFYKFSRPQS
ncbi:MAG TPA: hypothetical protein VGU27_04465 [Candidatus Eisenbacteria bacterium]|nr:hypothetical protein [Candidatus Eisenbacteria bacterium]